MKAFLVFEGDPSDELVSVLDANAFVIMAGSYEEAARFCNASYERQQDRGRPPYHYMTFLYPNSFYVLEEEDPRYEKNKGRLNRFFEGDKLRVCQVGNHDIICAFSDLDQGRLELSIVELPSVVSFPVHSAQKSPSGQLDY